MSIEAMKMALEAMTYADACLKKQLTTKTKHEYAQCLLLEAGTALRAAIEQAQKQEPVVVKRLRRGDILRCIETDELCTVWSTSTTGKVLVKWSANDFGAYTAEQIGDLFWLELEPDDLELAAEKSDNYAAFHAGYRFAVAHKNTGENQ